MASVIIIYIQLTGGKQLELGTLFDLNYTIQKTPSRYWSVLLTMWQAQVSDFDII